MVATPAPNRLSPRQIGLLLGGIALAIALFIFLAPNNSWQQSGSTYNKAPDGYAGWYADATQKGLSLTQSRQTLAELLKAQSKSPNAPPQTLLQIQPRLIPANSLFRNPVPQSKSQRRKSSQSNKPSKPAAPILRSSDLDIWLQAGNNAVILGVKQPVQRVPFSSRVPSPVGPIVIETSRRGQINTNDRRLADAAGAIVWESIPATAAPTPGQPEAPNRRGKLIFASTSYLAANAYQENPANYAFLTDLLTQLKAPIVIDESIHGYREPVATQSTNRRQKSGTNSPSNPPSAATEADRSDRSILDYFAQTPLLPIVVQSIVLLTIAIWARNRRFGRIKTLDNPTVDNSQAYIRALAGSLRQANSRAFVMETVGQAELRQLQQQLGLGSNPMTLPEIITAWTAQQQPTEDLKTLLRLQQRKDISDRELLTWLQSWQRLRQG